MSSERGSGVSGFYVPGHFRQDDIAALRSVIDAATLATFVTVAEGRPLASHIPMLFEPERGPHGTLWCHLARANPQWRTIAPSAEALAIFDGPDAYISPSWYASKAEHGKVVPTWNYVTVHATGTLRLFEDPRELRAHVEAITRRHESARAQPWHVSDAPLEYIDLQLRAIVGIEMTLTRLEGKWKLNQNRTPADVDGAIDGLEHAGDARARATAEAMRSASKR